MKKNAILLIVSFAMFMDSLDTTIINTAIPVMAHSLQVNPISLKLALISYLLSLAIFIPISGWVADRFGIKKVFIMAVALFTLSSAWCGMTQNLWELISARIVQGMGGALTLPIGRLLILRTYERHELIGKMSVVVMVASLGLFLGPLLGGIITDLLSWRWIFWVNIPAGIVTIGLSVYLLPEMPPCQVPPLDRLGFILFGSGLALLTLGLSMFSESEIDSLSSLITITLSIALLIGYARHSHRKEHPIVKMELLRKRTFRISIIGNLLARLSFGGMPFLLPLLLQIGLGYSPQLSGLLLTPVALGIFLVKPLSFPILRWLGYKKLLILNTALVGFCLWSFCLIDGSLSIIGISLITFTYGLLISLQYTGMNSLAYANIDPSDMSAATSIMSTIQQLAQSFGVAASAVFISFFSLQTSNHPGLTVTMFHHTFAALGTLTFLSGITFIFLQKQDGQELIASPVTQ